MLTNVGVSPDMSICIRGGDFEFPRLCCCTKSVGVLKAGNRGPCGVHPTSFWPLELVPRPIMFKDLTRLISFPGNHPELFLVLSRCCTKQT